MAQRGRPKLVENMNWYELQQHNNKQAIKEMTPHQIEAVSIAHDALGDFMRDFSEMFDVSTDTARKLQTSFWKMRHAFLLEKDD